MICCFFLAAFKILFGFRQFDYFILLGVCWASCRFLFFIEIWEVFGRYFFKYVPVPPLLVGIPSYAQWCLTGLWGSSDWMILIYIQVCWLCSLSVFYVEPLSIFFMSVIISLNSRISVWFYFFQYSFYLLLVFFISWDSTIILSFSSLHMVSLVLSMYF